MDYHVWDAMLEAYRKLKTKPKTIAELISASGYLGQPATGTDRQGYERLLKATEGLCMLELVVDTSNIHSDNTEFWHLIIS